MSQGFSITGKKFKKNDVVIYETLSGDKDYHVVVGKSESKPPGLILKKDLILSEENNNSSFAINIGAVNTRVDRLIYFRPQKQQIECELSRLEKINGKIYVIVKDKSTSKEYMIQEDMRNVYLSTKKDATEQTPQPTEPTSNESEQNQQKQTSSQEGTEEEKTTRREKIKNFFGTATSKTGKAIIKAPRRAFKGIINLAKGTGRLLKNIPGKKFTPDPNLSRTNKEIIIFLALVVHLLDFAFLNFALTTQAIGIRILMYFLLAGITMILVGDSEHYLSGFKYLLGIALIIIFAIPLIVFVAEFLGAPQDIMRTISGLILLMPLFILYLVLGSGIDFSLGGKNFIQKVLRLFIPFIGWAWFLIVILFTIFFFALIKVTSEVSTSAINEAGAIGIDGTGINTQEAIRGAIEIITRPLKSAKEFTTNVGDIIRRTGPALNTTFTTIYNNTMGEYYSGRVEQNTEQTGVFIESINTMGTYYEGQPVELFAILKVRSFVDAINLTPTCYAQDLRNESRKIKGKTEPTEILNVYRDDYRGIKCTFPQEEAFTAGRYEVVFEVNFNFETWAYITLTFMDREFVQSLRFERVDLQSRYNIRPLVRTIFTNGPVMIGMNDRMELPLTLTTNANNTLPIGMTIENRELGGRGEIVNVTAFELRLPNEFEIEPHKCILPPSTQYSNKTDEDSIIHGYKVHHFDVTNIPGRYLTVACSVDIFEEGAKSILNDPTGKRDVTIVGSAKYNYKLIRKTTIDVRKFG